MITNDEEQDKLIETLSESERNFYFLLNSRLDNLLGRIKGKTLSYKKEQKDREHEEWVKERDREQRREHEDWMDKVCLRRIEEENKLNFARMEQAKRYAEYPGSAHYDICERLW